MAFTTSRLRDWPVVALPFSGFRMGWAGNGLVEAAVPHDSFVSVHPTALYKKMALQESVWIDAVCGYKSSPPRWNMIALMIPPRCLCTICSSGAQHCINQLRQQHPSRALHLVGLLKPDILRLRKRRVAFGKKFAGGDDSWVSDPISVERMERVPSRSVRLPSKLERHPALQRAR